MGSVVKNEFKAPRKSRECQSSLDTKVLRSKPASSVRKSRKERIREKIWECQECEAKFCFESKLTRHETVHNKKEDPRHICPSCGFSSKSRSDLDRHLRESHPGEKLYPCNQCSKSLQTFQLREKHIKSMHLKIRENVKCELCDATLSSPNDLKSHHFRKHTDVFPYVCNFCDKKFKTLGEVNSHSTIHTTERPYQCEHCLKTFTKLGDTKAHIGRVHNKELHYTCQICKKQFYKGSHLKRHMNVHVDPAEREMQECRLCGQRFLSTASLNRHLRIHTGEKPHKCDHCPSAFLSTAELRVHAFAMHTHAGVGQFKCTICQRAFSFSSNMERHMRTKHGSTERPFRCDFCPKAFKDRSGLSYHLIIHTGERGYKCNACQSTFKNHTELHQHKKRCKTQ